MKVLQNVHSESLSHNAVSIYSPHCSSIVWAIEITWFEKLANTVGAVYMWRARSVDAGRKEDLAIVWTLLRNMHALDSASTQWCKIRASDELQAHILQKFTRTCSLRACCVHASKDCEQAAHLMCSLRARCVLPACSPSARSMHKTSNIYARNGAKCSVLTSSLRRKLDRLARIHCVLHTS